MEKLLAWFTDFSKWIAEAAGLVSPVVVEIRFFGIRALDFFLHSWLITNDLKSAKA